MPTRSEIAGQVSKKLGIKLSGMHFETENQGYINYGAASRKLWDALIESELRLQQANEIVDYVRTHHNTRADKLMELIGKYDLREAELGQQNGWISVEERLPEYDTDVLIWGAGWDAVYAGYWRHSEEWIGRHRAESDAELPGTNPTHWQPIPEPPEEQKLARMMKGNIARIGTPHYEGHPESLACHAPPKCKAGADAEVRERK